MSLDQLKPDYESNRGPVWGFKCTPDTPKKHLPNKKGEIMGIRKSVLMPIIVPNSDYCWGPSGDPNIDQIISCDHVDFSWGSPRCGLDLGKIVSASEEYHLKPEKCKNLQKGEK